MAKKKISLEIRQQVLSLFHQGYGYSVVAKKTKLSISTVENWLHLFRQGYLSWSTLEKSTYPEISIVIKQAAVDDYLSGNGGYRVISARYKIPGTNALVGWVKNYTEYGSISLKHSRSSIKRLAYKDPQIMKPKNDDQRQSEKEILEDKNIRIAFLENLMIVREEEETDPKKKAHLELLREQYEAAFPSRES